MKQPTEELEIMPPESSLAKSTTVVLLPQVALLSAGEIASGIRSDLESFDRSSREAAFAALRIGMRLIWVRDNGAHGALISFIRDEFAGTQSMTTLRRYISIAEKFAKEAGLVDRKTHLLTNGSAVSEIVSTQLELFTDPAAKFDGAMKKLMKWVGERGLTDLYADAKRGGKTYDRLKDADGNITKGKGKQLTEAEKIAQALKEASEICDAINAWIKALHHTRIARDIRAQVDAVLEDARARLKAVKD